jgi:hypothetical protein
MTTQIRRAADPSSWTPGRSPRTPVRRIAGAQPLVLEHAVAIKLLVDRYRARTLLDMGAGDGKAYGPCTLQLPDGTRYPSIPAYWDVDVLRCVDLAGPPADLDEPFDGVICTEPLVARSRSDAAAQLAVLFANASRFVFAHVLLARGVGCSKCHQCDRGPGPLDAWRNAVEDVARQHPQVRYQLLATPPDRTDLACDRLAAATLCG